MFVALRIQVVAFYTVTQCRNVLKEYTAVYAQKQLYVPRSSMVVIMTRLWGIQGSKLLYYPSHKSCAIVADSAIITD
jgi:hypothetical protein